MNREIKHVLEQAQTVRNLREMLEELDQDARVLFACNYGDYHHTQQALPVEEAAEYFVGTLVESGHSQSGIAFVDIDDDAEVKDQTTVVILTC